MNRKYLTIASIIVFTAIAVQVISCKKNGSATTTDAIALVTPAGFPQPQYNFSNNPLTKQGFELGRKLFYDGRLSKDGNFPCASCHQQFSAFITYDHDFSHGFNSQFTTRNALPIFNLAWQTAFQWDGGVNNLELQPLAPLTAANEMAEDINTVISKLKADNLYPGMFKAAFGNSEINSQLMLKAMAQFMVMMVSADSKYDRVKKGTASFTAEETGGYNTFKAKCAACHAEPLFTDLSYRNNGLEANSFLNDYGRMRITGKSTDSLKFKVPSLRNAALTFPYMHDGRLYTFDQVLNHYTTGIVQSPTLDPLLKNGISLNTTERVNIKAFLRTLTDSTFIKDPRFAQPR
jgi:cytochrome c peroxidase